MSERTALPEPAAPPAPGPAAAEGRGRGDPQARPDDAVLLERLGLWQLKHHRPLQARDTLLQAVARAPDSPGIRIHAAGACAMCRDARFAELLQPWRSWLPLDAHLQLELVSLQGQLGEAEAALELLEDLVARVPSEWVAQLSLAGAYERVNRLDAAEALLVKAADAGVAMNRALLAEMVHQRARLAFRRGEFGHALALLEQAGPRRDDDFAHWFAVAQACDRLGDVLAAMRALRVAHALQVREVQKIEPRLFEADAEVFPGVRARASASLRPASARGPAAGPAATPVFVVGFPRSGTTLVEQMLDAHPRLQSMDERPFFTRLAGRLAQSGGCTPEDLQRLRPADCEALRRDYFAMVDAAVRRRPGTRLVDKNPLNCLWLPLIQRIFPDAQFILVLRHPCDVILSCYLQNFRVTLLAAASRSLEHLARAYCSVLDAWACNAQRLKPDVLEVRHEALVAEPAAQVRRIGAFLGLEHAESMLEFAAHARGKRYIRTPSYAEVVEPINANGVGRWRRYGEFLAPVLPILAPQLDRWGYAGTAPRPR